MNICSYRPALLNMAIFIFHGSERFSIYTISLDSFYLFIFMYAAVWKFWVGKIFNGFEKSLVLTKAAFIWSQIQ